MRQAPGLDAAHQQLGDPLVLVWDGLVGQATARSCSSSPEFVADPSVGAMAKAPVASSDRTAAIARIPLARVAGPTADAVSEALRGYTEYRLRNVQTIVECADAKCSSLEVGGTVKARVAHVVLADGSYCDDALVRRIHQPSGRRRRSRGERLGGPGHRRLGQGQAAR